MVLARHLDCREDLKNSSKDFKKKKIIILKEDNFI